MRIYDIFYNNVCVMRCAAMDPVEAYKKKCKVNKLPFLIVKDINRNETYKVTYFPHTYGKSDFLVEEIFRAPDFP